MYCTLDLIVKPLNISFQQFGSIQDGTIGSNLSQIYPNSHSSMMSYSLTNSHMSTSLSLWCSLAQSRLMRMAEFYPKSWQCNECSLEERVDLPAPLGPVMKIAFIKIIN